MDQIDDLRTQLACLDAHLTADEANTETACPFNLYNSKYDEGLLLARVQAQVPDFLARSKHHVSDVSANSGTAGLLHEQGCGTILNPLLEYKDCHAQNRLTTELMKVLAKPNAEVLNEFSKYSLAPKSELCHVLLDLAEDSTKAELHCEGANFHLILRQDDQERRISLDAGHAGANQVVYGGFSKKSSALVNGALRSDFNPATVEADYQVARAFPAFAAASDCCISKGTSETCNRFTDYYSMNGAYGKDHHRHYGRIIENGGGGQAPANDSNR